MYGKMTKLKNGLRKILFIAYKWLHRTLHNIGVLPISRNFGIGRGSPVGRYYVEHFLREQAGQVRGHCLEFGDARYASLFSGFDTYEVTDLEEGEDIDYPGDIHDPSTLPKEYFNTIICVQVFEHLKNPQRAAKILYQSMKRSGVLLLTAPFINPVHYVPTDFWRFTPEAITMILIDSGFEVEVIDFGGNSLVSTGSLLGMVQEDFTDAELQRKDPVYPYNILVRARKPHDN